GEGDDIDLPSESLMRGVNAHGSPIAAGPSMNIDAIVGTHLGGVFQLGERHKKPAGAVKKDEGLVTIQGGCVEEEPLAARQNGRMEMDGPDVRHAMRHTRTVVSVDRKLAPFEDRMAVQPRVMAGDIVEEPHVLAVGRDRPASGIRRSVRVFQKGDKTCAQRVPTLAEKVQVR